MPFFGNRRRDFSIQPPRQQVDGTPFFVTDSAKIDFTLNNLNLTADLTFTGVTAGTYGDATNIPVLQIDQWGRVTGVTTVPIGGGGGTYTVNNGLSAQTVPSANPNNFQLGSTTSGGAPLLHDTYIDTVVNHTLYLEGQKTNSSDAILSIDNTASGGTALRVTGSGNSAAINAQSTDNYGVFGTSNTFFGIVGQTLATARAGVLAEVISNSFSSVLPALRIRHLTSGTPLVGFGAAIDFRAATVSNSELPLGRLMYQWTDPVTISRTSKFQIETVNLNVAAIKLEVDGPGQLKLNRYGQTPANFPGTPVWSLGVDASGNVVEFTGGGPPTTGDSISPFLLMGG